MNKLHRILIIGGPGSGKTSVLKEIEQQGHLVHHEISRAVIARAQEQGIDQLFLEDPFAFSNELLDGRIQQFHDATAGLHFYDRGIPDVPAYHLFTGDLIPEHYMEASRKYRYDQVFFLPPWKEIYISDQERYENYDQAVRIGNILNDFYTQLNYHPIEVPKMEVVERLHFILDHIKD